MTLGVYSLGRLSSQMRHVINNGQERKAFRVYVNCLFRHLSGTRVTPFMSCYTNKT